MDKSLMGPMVAFAPLPPIGMATGVNLTTASVGRSGQTLAVNVSLGTTSMVHYVCYASMDNNGTPSEEHAIAQPTTLGMVTCVAKEYTALEAESTTLSMISVYVMARSSGMDGIVWWSLIVVAGKCGTKHLSSATVLNLSIGMEIVVYFVWTGKYGMKIPGLVNAKQVLNGMGSFVWWFRPVREVWFGIRTLSHVNAQVLLSGMGITAFRTHAQEARCGIPSGGNVSVWALRYSWTVDVFSQQVSA